MPNWVPRLAVQVRRVAQRLENAGRAVNRVRNLHSSQPAQEQFPVAARHTFGRRRDTHRAVKNIEFTPSTVDGVGLTPRTAEEVYPIAVHDAFNVVRAVAAFFENAGKHTEVGNRVEVVRSLFFAKSAV